MCEERWLSLRRSAEPVRGPSLVVPLPFVFPHRPPDQCAIEQGAAGAACIQVRPGQVAAEGLTDYFRTHPGSWERRNHLRAEIEKLPRRRAPAKR